MAESQAFYTYNAGGQGIINGLSKARFEPYLISAGYSADYAFNLYLYNARLAKAFLFPLHVLEITLRNRINSILGRDFSPQWHDETAFKALLTNESSTVLDKARLRAKTSNIEDVVATLTFDFWSNLFRSEYDRPLWQTRMKDLLPNNCMSRKQFQKVVKKLNDFRNRIAHHEPIHNLDLLLYHSEILAVLSWISTETFEWVKHYSTVNTTIRSVPNAHGESLPHFKERNDSNFNLILATTLISELPASRFLLCHDIQQKIIAVVERQHICNYLLAHSSDGELIIDLKEHDLNKVIVHQNLNNNFVDCGASESFSRAPTLFKGGVEYLVVRDSTQLCGVIAKAHRRY